MSPKVLDQVLAGLPRAENPNVLVGFDTADDAGVYQLDPDTALVQTLDFFTPIVDDPYLFGAISAANSLSDVWAMGGRPMTALSILCYPAKGDLDDLQQILRGGAAKMEEAGCVVIGGHSVSDDEIKFGYSVTGHVNPRRVWANSKARPGDHLVFTKSIGTGVISTALKRGIAAEPHIDAAVESMLLLNRSAYEALLPLEVHGCTDVSGFGLLGHAREIAVASKVTLELNASAVPLLPGALDYAQAGAVPGGLRNNREFVSPCVSVDDAIPQPLHDLMYDPQTSGGLLVSLPAGDAARLRGFFPAACVVGRVLERSAVPIVLRA